MRTGPGVPLELYDLANDLAEAKDLAAVKPKLVAEAEALMKAAHTPDPNWPRTGRSPERVGKPPSSAKGQ